MSLLDAINNMCVGFSCPSYLVLTSRRSSHARLENKLNTLIAEVRAGKREGSVISTKTLEATAQNGRDTWEALRRDLEDVGISRDVITEKRHIIIAWFQEAVAAGKLEEDPLADDEDLVVSVCGSDGAADETDGDSVLGKEMASTMIWPNTTEENFDLVFYKSGWKDILDAAIAGDVPVVRTLHVEGVDIETKGQCDDLTIIFAAKFGQESAIRALLDNDANVNAEDYDGQIALMWAVKRGHESILRLLLEKGAKVDAKDEGGRTALSWAEVHKHPAVTQLLRDAGKTSMNAYSLYNRQ